MRKTLIQYLLVDWAKKKSSFEASIKIKTGENLQQLLQIWRWIKPVKEELELITTREQIRERRNKEHRGLGFNHVKNKKNRH